MSEFAAAQQYDFRALYFGAAQLCKIEEDAAALIQAKQIANDVLVEVANMRNWVFLEKHWFFTTEADRYEYALPNNVDTIIEPMYSMTNNARITQGDPRLYAMVNPNPSSSSSSMFYMCREMGPANQPYSELSFVSDDAADTTQTLTVGGWSYGRYLTEEIELDGTTAVTSEYKYLYLHKVDFDAECAGSVACTSNNDSNTSVTNFTATTGTTEITSFTQPSDNPRISSTSAADTTPLKVTIIGIISQGGVDVEIREDITLNGTGTVYATNRFSKILGVNKSQTTGTVLVEGTTAVLWQGAPLEETTEHIIINLIPPPSARDTIMVRYIQKVFPRTNDGDPLSPFPQKFVPALKHLVASYLYDFIGHNVDKALSERRHWEEMKKEFMYKDSLLRGRLVMIGRGRLPLGVHQPHPYGTFSIVSG